MIPETYDTIASYHPYEANFLLPGEHVIDITHSSVVSSLLNTCDQSFLTNKLWKEQLFGI
jgi:hypothetical protein